jgi:hypothetical protein
MSKKSAAFEAKFEITVKTLLKAPNLTVQEAMLVAKLVSGQVLLQYTDTQRRGW